LLELLLYLSRLVPVPGLSQRVSYGQQEKVC
jgi:hypothetical protein